ncbi:hypothetical protein SAMN05216357_110105 [Porphyromonadaceae bacterium KH3CP3RA]|nr:hypothetical protein SAMN05216357_110105 [Porphyromonadaceae bacterium KH3CP3RA]
MEKRCFEMPIKPENKKRYPKNWKEMQGVTGIFSLKHPDSNMLILIAQ